MAGLSRRHFLVNSAKKTAGLVAVGVLKSGCSPQEEKRGNVSSIKNIWNPKSRMLKRYSQNQGKKRTLVEETWQTPSGGWNLAKSKKSVFHITPEGLVFLPARNKKARIDGPGIFTRHGDSIEIDWYSPEYEKGSLCFGFAGGFEYVSVELDFEKKMVHVWTVEWDRPQPVKTVPFQIGKQKVHKLKLEKLEGNGKLVKLTDLVVTLDGQALLTVRDLNVLPEMGVRIRAQDKKVIVKRFVQKGVPSGIPEYLNLGGWQVLNLPDIEKNLESLFRGLQKAADAGIQLLVTPETSLTGLFPDKPVTNNRTAIAQAEQRLQKFMGQLKNAPYLIAGLPVWKKVPWHKNNETRYNASRLYDPDGRVVSTHPKIHSCEHEFYHGYQLHEFDVYGAPCCMHICHDGRYPELWTLPVMFGSRLVVHPANGGNIIGTIDGFEARAKRSTGTSHAFYINVSGGGGSYITGPKKYDNLLAVSDECKRKSKTLKKVGAPVECLIQHKCRIHDALGCWPVRSFRASEEVARSYVNLYRSMGGRRISI
jgi:predicted amidohydrolase